MREVREGPLPPPPAPPVTLAPDATQAYRLHEWNGIKSGQYVNVRGVGIKPGMRFYFVAFVRAESGDTFVEAIGGKRGKANMRYFHPDNVSAIPAKRVRQPRRVPVST